MAFVLLQLQQILPASQSISTNSHSYQECERSSCSTHNTWCYLPTFLISAILVSMQLVFSHMALICIFLMANKIEHLFILIDKDIALCEVPSQVFCRLFFLLVSRSFLYILHTSPLSAIYIVNVFAQFVGCLFTFLMFLLINKNSF